MTRPWCRVPPVGLPVRPRYFSAEHLRRSIAMLPTAEQVARLLAVVTPEQWRSIHQRFGAKEQHDPSATS